MTSTCQEFVSCNFLRTIVLKMHSINALENKSITLWSVTQWDIILFSLMVSQESREEGLLSSNTTVSAVRERDV